ncbi:MAG: hypothetical protein AAF217_00020 [Pseudomonadota bacterium]
MADMQSIDALRQDVELHGVTISEAEWRSLCKDFSCCAYPQGDVIIDQARVADRWLFLTKGIAASEQTTTDGDALIARFFEKGHFCSNLTSAWGRQIASDELIAITNIEGVILPNALFREQYLRGNAFGEYLRMKTMEALMFDKEILCAKTSNDTELQFSFLEYSHSDVVQKTAQKDLARFIGITPQGLSRFLKNRRSNKA